MMAMAEAILAKTQHVLPLFLDGGENHRASPTI
jgi:hypothetical protein